MKNTFTRILLYSSLCIFVQLSLPDFAIAQSSTVSGTISDEDGGALPGVNVLVKGTTTGAITDIDGNYRISVPDQDATLIFSYIGYLSQEVPLNGRTTVNISLAEDVQSLEEVVVVGYGTKKKINLTGAVSVAGKEDLENRPVANVQQALQGVVSNLVIQPNAAGGEPGSDMNMSIRGLSTFEGSNAPFVLVDGIPMSINDIDPNDIESISVLKDVASTSIYGARAAYGVILITTKEGSKGSRISYSTNYAWSTPTVWPDLAGGTDWAHALNDARTNSGGTPFYPEEALDRLRQNLENPGSAPGMLPRPDGLDWDILNTGSRGVANDNIQDLILRDNAPRYKHSLAISGGNDRINYYVGGTYYNEQGLLTFGDESYDRLTLDAKVGAKATEWLDINFRAKYKQEDENFPWNQNFGRAWYMNWIGKLKPGTPAKYDGTDIWTRQTRVEEWRNVRQTIADNQIVLSPELVFEPIEGWVTNVRLNYRANQIEDTRFAKQFSWVRPTGQVDLIPENRAQTQYRNAVNTNTYLSPNIWSTYTNQFGKHSLEAMVGFQQEEYNYSNVGARSVYLLSDAVPALSTAVGEQLVTDEIGHWAIRSYFGRLNYRFAEKYLLEVNFRADGSSRFNSENRWGYFPSASAGWIISEENFFPKTNVINTLKLRGSYGSLGNQNVDNYLYIPTLPVQQTNFWLFGGDRAWTVGAPNLSSVNLTWETVSTLDLGLDAALFDDRLNVMFGVYESVTSNLVGPGRPLPAALGTTVPKRNEGEINTRGWELELSWRNTVSSDFKYQIKGQLSDYRSKVVNYTNPTRLIDRPYNGQIMGEIWGLTYDGHYQSDADVSEHGVDQSFIWSGAWTPGDFKYKDLNGDGRVDIGDNTFDNPGDLSVIGNTTPRFVYGFSLGAEWRNFDASVFFQGTGKRDWAFAGTSASVFRGPAGGPMHNNVLEEHLDYWRDETSALGANPDAYFPKPYAQYFGQNAKNYSYPTDHLMQDASFLRLKNLQIGYSLPRFLAEKVWMSNARIYVSGENLLTFTNLMFFDPEALQGRWYGAGDSYPLSKTWSVGLNVNF
jgi:TonB-linked SusC/RagA family outer membrane protein